MENNTVILDIEEYNKLRDFKKSIEAGEVCLIANINLFSQKMGEWKFYKAEKLDKIIVAENIKLSASLSAEKTRNAKLIEQIQSNKTKTRDELKKMSIWEFRKWKKSLHN